MESQCILFNIFSNINNLHIKCTSSRLYGFYLQIITVTLYFYKTHKSFVKFSVTFFFHSLGWQPLFTDKLCNRYSKKIVG